MSDFIVKFLRQSIANEVGVAPADVVEDIDFETLGMSSLNAVLISGAIEDEFGVEIEPSLMFEHRTLATLKVALDRLFEAARG